MILRRTIGPALPAITLAEAKMHLRVDSNAEDEYITSLIYGAMGLVDGTGALGLSISEQTWTLWVPQSPGVVRVTMGPFIEITKISYYDTDSVLQDGDVTDFEVRLDSDFVNVRPKSGKAWPPATSREDAIAIQFTAGFSETPDGIKHALKLLIGHWYPTREAVSELSLKEVPLAFSALIENERLGWYGG